LAFDVTFAEVVAPIASIRIGTERLYRKLKRHAIAIIPG
jgi:hypothetical protein